jgi:hypothetical protein
MRLESPVPKKQNTSSRSARILKDTLKFIQNAKEINSQNKKWETLESIFQGSSI